MVRRTVAFAGVAPESLPEPADTRAAPRSGASAPVACRAADGGGRRLIGLFKVAKYEVTKATKAASAGHRPGRCRKGRASGGRQRQKVAVGVCQRADAGVVRPFAFRQTFVGRVLPKALAGGRAALAVGRASAGRYPAFVAQRDPASARRLCDRDAEAEKAGACVSATPAAARVDRAVAPVSYNVAGAASAGQRRLGEGSSPAPVRQPVEPR